MFLNSLAVGVVRANNLLCFSVYLLYEWAYTVSVPGEKKKTEKVFLVSGNMVTFLVPCSYLPSVTLQKKIKHPRPFKSLKNFT